METLVKKRLLMPFLVGISAALLSGCPSQESEPQTDPNAHIETYAAPARASLQYNATASQSQQFQQQHSAYTAEQLHYQPLDEDNYHASPFDQQQFMAMISLGAVSDTLDALGSSVGLGTPTTKTHQTISALQQQLNELPSIQTRSSLWGQQSYPFFVDYLQQQSLYYAPELLGADFVYSAAMVQDEIVSWLGNPSVLLEISNKTRLVAAQQSEVNTTWSATLTTTQIDGRFAILEEDRQRWVKMVKIDGNMETAEQEDYRAVKIPLSDPSLSLQIITPKLGRFSAVKSRVDDTFITTLQRHYQLQTHSISLPHFSLSQLGWPEGAMDIGVASIEEQAALSAVNNHGELYLLTPQREIDFTLDANGIQSKTILSITHEATKDEQWTPSPDPLTPSFPIGLVSTTASPETPCYHPPDQRPLLFILYEQQTGAILQTGQVTTLYGRNVSPDWYVSPWSACGTRPPITIME